MMGTRWLVLFVAAWVGAAGEPAEVHVSTVARDGRVHVSCTVTGGLTPDLGQALQSGLTTTLTYDVELRRAVSVWFDRGLAASTVSASARFDTLTGRYQVTRSVDGRIEDSRVSELRGDVERFVTSFDRLPLFGTATLEANVEYVVRVRLRARPRVNWLLWPFNRSDASGLARFTFIP